MARNRGKPLQFLNPATLSSISVTGGGSYLQDSSGVGSASGSFQNGGYLDLVDGDSDADFGSSRSDFRQSPLVGTVEYYDRHVFLCYKNPRVWPSHINSSEFDRLPRLLSASLVVKKNDIKKQTRLTICEGHDGTETSNGDVLIFPDMIRYRRLTHFDIDTFVEEVLVKDGEWLPGTPEALKGFYIFVCSHGARDRRCGVCGPPIISKFREEIESHGLQSKVFVSPCSHIGGHAYAGNVIIFGSSIGGSVTGHWYGYVTPDDVPSLLEKHIRKGEIVDWLWRGQMGLSEEDQKRSQELRLQQNGKVDVGRSGKEEETQTNCNRNALCGSQLDGFTCCRINGSSCWNNLTAPEETENSELNEREAKMTADEKRSSKRRGGSLRNGGGVKGGAERRKSFTRQRWFENWEREDTYAALAVVGAALSVALAYRCYKQSQ